MKYLITAFASIAFIFSSCNTEGDSSSDKATSSSFSKNIDLDQDICKLITKEMVVSYFDVQKEELELKDDINKSNNAYSSCGYAWKKENYEELKEKRTDMMMAYAMKGVKKNDDNTKEVTMSDIMKLDSPLSLIKIEKLKKYEELDKAVRSFENSHKVPTKKDMKKLHKEIDKKGDQEGLDEKSKDMGKKLTGGIASNLKFTKVDGIGDQAFFDHLDKSLDVRFGLYTFSLIIDTELSLETNIDIAKKIAQEVWDKL